MSIINATPLLAAAGGDYQISRSVRLRSSASAYFNRTPASAGNRKTWTWSGWVKRGALSAQQTIFSSNQASDRSFSQIVWQGSDNAIDFLGAIDSSGVVQARLTTSSLYRDPSAWYHIVAVFDTTNATSTERIRLFVNGVRITAFASATYPSQNYDGFVNATQEHTLSSLNFNGTRTNYLDGYLTEVNFIDGQALTPSSFGETDSITGVWKPKKYAGTYGTNGFFLNFSDNSAATAAAIGKDYSGNGNNWTPNNISVTAGATYDSMLDVPTLYADGGNGRGNYAVLNPLDGNNATLSNGNLSFVTILSGTGNSLGTIYVSSGKWYWEISPTSSGNSSYFGIRTGASGYYIAYDAFSGNKDVNGTTTAYGATYTNGDIIGVALDMDAGTVTFYKNNVSQGAITIGNAGPFSPWVSDGSSTASVTGSINFGQRPFAYTPPTGFKALNTQNLPEPTIKKGNQYFDVSLWTGDQAARTITNSGSFQPDLIWTKSRSDAESHRLHDAVRGGNGSVLYELNSNLTEAEGTDTLVSGFATNGFTIASGANTPNITGRTYAAWQWKESPSAGFDIVTYTGTGVARTVAHSLGVAPSMIIVKRRNSTGEWLTYTQMTGNTHFLELNTTAASFASSTAWNNTSPTSSVFSVGTASAVNASGGTYVAYLFSEVAGFSKFGSYTGNGSADGPFVYLGFRPRWVLFKVSSAAGFDWLLYDSSRNTYNVTNLNLRPDLSAAEGSQTANNLDFLSNGFKIRGDSTGSINPAQTIIFAAFAENPFKNSLAR